MHTQKTLTLVDMQTPSYKGMHVFTLYTCTQMDTNTHIHTHIYSMSLHTYVHTHVHILIHMNLHCFLTHTYTHACTQSNTLLLDGDPSKALGELRHQSHDVTDNVAMVSKCLADPSNN